MTFTSCLLSKAYCSGTTGLCFDVKTLLDKGKTVLMTLVSLEERQTSLLESGRRKAALL